MGMTSDGTVARSSGVVLVFDRFVEGRVQPILMFIVAPAPAEVQAHWAMPLVL
jgi:hypothetical protein